MPALLTPERLAEAMLTLPAWTSEGGSIRRELRAATASALAELLLEIARVSDALDHHPDVEWSAAKASIRLWTHDAGGLTELDLELAAAIDARVAAAGFGDAPRRG